MARQTAAGFREAGPLLTGLAGGGAEGIDLTPSARRVLCAQQMLLGLRAAGSLLISPPPGELPPVSSYPPPLVGPLTAPGPAALGRAQGYLDSLQQLSSYGAAQRMKPRPGWAASNVGRAEMLSAFREQSDSLCIPYSTGLLGSFSPYRGVAFPQELRCFECGAAQQHYAAECPARFARVRGEPPPGWKMDHLGTVVKDPAAWNGPELTDAARAKYRDFLGRFALMPHLTFPVSSDDILGSTPAPMRRPLPKYGGERRQ